MKISKLFHWLYAFIMLLPAFAVLTTCLVQTFNSQAKSETISKINYKYETNDVNTNDDIIVGRAYYVDIEEYLDFSENQDFMFYVISIDQCSPYFDDRDNYLDEAYLSDIECNGEFIGALQPNMVNFYWGDDSYFAYGIEQQGLFIRALVVIGEYNQKSETAFYSFSSGEGDIPIESVEELTMTEDVFYRAIDKVKASPLFSWAYNSFLAVPITYVTNLFGLPSTSIVIELLSYWLAISVIWLVFDLIMYVPLLAHKYIDKAVIE